MVQSIRRYEKNRLIQRNYPSQSDEGGNPLMIIKDYEDKSAIYNWTEEDFENLKPKVDTYVRLLKVMVRAIMSRWNPVVSR